MKVATLCGTITIDVYKKLTGLNFISLVHSSNTLKLPFPWGLETWTLITLMMHQLAVLLLLPQTGSAVLLGQGFSPHCSPVYPPHALITLPLTSIMVFLEFHHIWYVWYIWLGTIVEYWGIPSSCTLYS